MRIGSKLIRKFSLDKNIKLIEPFCEDNLNPSSYDITLGNLFKTPVNNSDNRTIDPKKVIEYKDILIKDDQYYLLRSGEFVLATTIEKVNLKLELELDSEVHGRSSYGRIGLVIHSTAGYIDPTFSGNITLELYNFNKYNIKLYPGSRIGQLVFDTIYPDSIDKIYDGKYVDQVNTTGSRVHEDFK
jgi:dCTP deaminase